MSEAQALIDQKEYDAAITMLVEIIRQDPEMFDEIQVKIEEIREIQTEYNAVLEGLVNDFEDENLTEAYDKINQLREINPNPNDSTENIIRQATLTAGLIVTQQTWTTAMNAAGDLIAQEDYSGALQFYMDNFDIAEDIFQAEQLDTRSEETKDSYNLAAAYRSNIESAAIDFIGMMSAFDSELDAALNSVGTGEVDRINTAYSTLISTLGNVVEARKQILENTDNLLILRESIRASELQINEVPYLYFMAVASRGDSDQTGEKEYWWGIAGILDHLWTNAITSAESLLLSHLAQMFNQSVDQFQQFDFDQSDRLFTNVLSIAGVSEQIIRGWEDKYPFDSDEELSPEAQTYVESELLKLYSTRLISDLSGQYLENSLNFTISRERLDGTAQLTIPDRMYERRDDLSGARENIEVSLADVEGLRDEYQSLINEGYIPAEQLAQFGILPGLMEREIALLKNSELDLLVRAADIRINPLEEDFTTYSADLQRGKGYAEGANIDVEGFEVLARYPEEALDLYTTTEDNLRTLKVSVDQLSDFLVSETQEVISAESYRVQLSRMEELSRNISSLEAELPGLYASVREQILYADRYKNEAETRVQEAEANLRSGNYDNADQKVKDASRRVDKSLEYRWDTDLIAWWDAQSARLGSEITASREQEVFDQRLELLSSAKQYYNLGEFTSAENSLLRAQSLWSTIRPNDPDPEIENWLDTIQNALSVSSGREFIITDPLYNEMNQLLNLATRDYLEGKALNESGKKTESLVYLDSANKRIANILYQFPNNKDARLLALKILQISEEREFEITFTQKFQAARDKITPNDREASADAYLELKDLEGINPDYPGLAQAIEDAEYASGRKTRPPDRTKIIEAESLYNKALQIYNRNDVANFSLGLAYCDQALGLNPAYDAASILKDRFLRASGGTASVVLSSLDERQYQEAEASFRSKNYLGARIIIDKLMQKEDNRRVVKVIELGKLVYENLGVAWPY